MKHILATSALSVGVTLAMMCAQPVFAQSATSETTVSKSVDENGVAVKRTDKATGTDGSTIESSNSVKATPEGTQVKRSQKVTDGVGGEIERSRTYSNDGTEKKVTTTSRKKTADGAEESSRTEKTVTPN